MDNYEIGEHYFIGNLHIGIFSSHVMMWFNIGKKRYNVIHEMVDIHDIFE